MDSNHSREQAEQNLKSVENRQIKGLFGQRNLLTDFAESAVYSLFLLAEPADSANSVSRFFYPNRSIIFTDYYSDIYQN